MCKLCVYDVYLCIWIATLNALTMRNAESSLEAFRLRIFQTNSYERALVHIHIRLKQQHHYKLVCALFLRSLAFWISMWMCMRAFSTSFSTKSQCFFFEYIYIAQHVPVVKCSAIAQYTVIASNTFKPSNQSECERKNIYRNQNNENNIIEKDGKERRTTKKK